MKSVTSILILFSLLACCPGKMRVTEQRTDTIYVDKEISVQIPPDTSKFRAAVTRTFTKLDTVTIPVLKIDTVFLHNNTKKRLKVQVSGDSAEIELQDQDTNTINKTIKLPEITKKETITKIEKENSFWNTIENWAYFLVFLLSIAMIARFFGK